MPVTAEFRRQITLEIVQSLEAGTPPWRRTWSGLKNTGVPANASSGQPYRGVNPLLLQLASSRMGFESRWWATYCQWQALGGNVRTRPNDIKPGRWGTKIVYFRPAREHGSADELDSRPVLRHFTVFNVDQVDGPTVDQFRVCPLRSMSFPDFEPAERLVASTGATVVPGIQPAYSPAKDVVYLPAKESFDPPHDYYATAFHELVHWTGHPKRLRRLQIDAGQATDDYAFEELVAEIGSSFVCADVGIPCGDRTNRDAYLAHWARGLADRRLSIFRAAAAASDAADFLSAFNGGGNESSGERSAATAHW